VTSSVAVFEAAIRVKSLYMIKSCFENEKNRKYGNERINLHLTDGLGMEFTDC